MTQEEKCLRVLFPLQWTVNSAQLQPFTLGHYLLLKRLGNPFVSEEKDGRFGGGDLAQAVFVCSRSWKQAIKAFRGWKWPLRFRMLRWTWYGAKLIDGASQFQAYLMDAMTGPTVLYADGKKIRKLKAPYWLVMIRRRRARGMTTEAVLDESMKWLSIEDASAGEEAGTLEWCSENEIAAQQLARRLIAAARAEQAKAAASGPASGPAPEEKEPAHE